MAALYNAFGLTNRVVLRLFRQGFIYFSALKMETQYILHAVFVDLLGNILNHGDITVPKPYISLHIVIIRFSGVYYLTAMYVK